MPTVKENFMKANEYVQPKSYIYTGEHKDVPTHIVHYQISSDNVLESSTLPPHIEGKQYIQVIGLSDVDAVFSIGKKYDIDLLVIEDIFNVRQRNKIELFDDSLFGAFHLEYLEKNEVKKDYMSIFFKENIVISFHETNPAFLSGLKPVFEQGTEVRTRSIDYVFYLLLDVMTDHHLEIFEMLDEQSTMIEDMILSEKTINQESFYMVRKEMLKLKNSVSPVLNHLEYVLREKPKLIQRGNIGYFNDLLDHLNRLDNHLNQSRELMRNLLDLQINNQSHKMNRIMTTLTLFSAIFIPLGFLTGFFGMNFVHFGILAYEHALGLFVGFSVLLALFMIILFKKMKWF